MNALVKIESSELIATDTRDNQVIEMWLHGKPATTQRMYRADIKRFFSFAVQSIAKIDLATIQAYSDRLTTDGLSTASRARMIASVKSLFSFAKKMGFIQLDPASVTRLPKVTSKLDERILTKVQVIKMIGDAGDCQNDLDRRNRALLSLMYVTGIRNAEVRALKWCDVAVRDSGGQITVIGKGSKVRSIRVPESVWNQLQALRGDAGDNDPVFRSRERDDNGNVRGLDQATVNRIVHKFADQAGIKKSVSPHWLRHAHASHAIENNAPLHLVQSTLGHSSLGITGRYLHARPGESSSNFIELE